MQNVKIERLGDGLFALYQDEGPEGVQSIILSEANVMDLWAVATRHPSADEGQAATARFQEALDGLDGIVHVPATKSPWAHPAWTKKPPRRHAAARGVVWLSGRSKRALVIIAAWCAPSPVVWVWLNAMGKSGLTAVLALSH